MRNLDSNMFAALERYRERGEMLVLATIVETAGSTYRKAGARMLIDREGKYFGLLGGGCFEGDLVEHARDVYRSGQAQVVKYDLRAGSEAMWGLGLGCNGAVSILLQRLSPDNDYQPAAFLSAQRAAGRDAYVASITYSDDKSLVGKSICLNENRMVVSSQLDDSFENPISRNSERELTQHDHVLIKHDEHVIYCERVARPRRLLILGGGPDAQPLALMALSLAWHVTVCDHRPAYLDDWPSATGLVVSAAENGILASSVSPDDHDAALIMSHNFDTDVSYLQQLAHSNTAYIGVLGPGHRKELLLESLDETIAAHLHNKLFGPVGMDIGGDSPESIALSVLSEIHCVLEDGRSGHLGAPLENNSQGKRRA